jgi:hypothetical protein
MKDYIFESVMQEIDGSDTKLMYLDEYLILAPQVTLKEAKELIVLAEEDRSKALEKIQVVAKKRSEKIKDWFKNAYAKAKAAGNKEKMKKIKDAYEKKMSKLSDWASRMKKAATDKAGSNISKIKLAYGKIGPKTKIGAAAGLGIAAAGAGYAGYRAAKNRKKALPQK